MRNTRQKDSPRGRVRIIGGCWRGRVLGFPETEGLRPTPDRVRETLFNWLQPRIEGSHCLDLFAGSGALGFEALSRGAATVTLVERSPAVALQLREAARLLAASGARIVQRDALAFLGEAQAAAFDIVFLDPPFHQGLVERAIGALCCPGMLSASALVYVESGKDEPAPQTPTSWTLYREKRAGQVAYRLYATG
ncbi:MAG: 16S rRNA (guanine(966)-N(2))-methyltransferase RsmD [Gammaproteobacteria bacterium]